MKILVLNCGSSSVRYQVFGMSDERVMAKGVVEKIGLPDATLTHRPTGKDKVEIVTSIPDHATAISMMADALTHPEYGIVSSLDEIDIVGHRIVHGGAHFIGAAMIDEQVIAELERLTELAPLHNPPSLAGIHACEEAIPGVPMVAVFDTAFHQTMEPEAYLYPLPYEMYERHGIRRFGFHGTSNKYITSRVEDILKTPAEDLKIINCHLGNGCSITAIRGGKSVNTSMGFTPLEGLMMGTRCGDVDPAVVAYIMRKENWDAHEASECMNKRSGLLGVSGVSNDLRNVIEEAEKGHMRSQLAIDMFCKSIVRYIGAYMAEMNGVDVIVLTAGVGENSPLIREKVCRHLEFVGVEFDPEENKKNGKEHAITTPDSKVKVMVIPTNEELMIAREAKTLLEKRHVNID